MSARFARVALPSDAPAIARVAHAAWSVQPWLSAAAEQLAEADLQAQWHDLLADLAGMDTETGHDAAVDAVATAFVATDDDEVIGWLLTSRAESHDDAHELLDFAVAPTHQRRGHASRLVHAAADRARAQGSTWLLAWCPLPDEARRAFLGSHGFAPDGALRELSDGSETLTETRLVAALSNSSTG